MQIYADEMEGLAPSPLWDEESVLSHQQHTPHFYNMMCVRLYCAADLINHFVISPRTGNPPGPLPTPPLIYRELNKYRLNKNKLMKAVP